MERIPLATKIKNLDESIAIIGMACRFPGQANTSSDFFELMVSERDCIIEVPTSRWDINQYYDSNPEASGKMYVREGGFITNIDQFDAHFFNISPREANVMDPQQRLLLEVSWEALELSAQSPAEIFNQSVGIFIGVSHHEYANIAYGLEPTAMDAYSGLGNFQSILAGRLSHWLGTRGPSMVIDTACSSSLVAIHQACQSLKMNDCNLALCGGISLMLSPLGTIFGCKMKALSPDGRCKSFDSSANGYGRGEGAGVIVLKRLSEAMANGDNILAVISGSAVNHDGRSSGLTVPNGQAQRELLHCALNNAKISPDDVSYIEAHATGTVLGDPIEVNAILDVFSHRNNNNPLFLGSIKPNIGHLESAAGVASIIKIILMLQHRIIPKQLHFNKLNPYIDLKQAPISIPTRIIPWQVNKYFAGVSSFGFSGTNAHVILTTSPSISKDIYRDEKPYVLPLSAKTPAALNELANLYIDYLLINKNSMTDICFTASLGRFHFPLRVVFVSHQAEDIIELIKCWLHKEEKSLGQIISCQDYNKTDSAYLMAKAYINKENVDWESYYDHYKYQRVVLPLYPFQRQRFWIEKDNSKLLTKQINDSTHPLLGNYIQSPIPVMQFNTEIDINQEPLSFLHDHSLQGKVIFPGTGYIEMMLAVGQFLFQTQQILLQDIHIYKPLYIEKNSKICLFTVVEPQGTFYTVKIYSSNCADEKKIEWVEHVNGRVFKLENLPSSVIPFGLLPELTIKDFKQTQLSYGPSFLNIRKIYLDTKGRAIGEISISDDQTFNMKYFLFHPALLDSCLQVGTWTLPEIERQTTFVPIKIQAVKLYKSPEKNLCSYATLTQPERINFSIFDDKKDLVLEIIDLTLKKVGENKLVEKSNILYRPEWTISPLYKKNVVAVPNNKFYLIFGNDDRITESVKSFLKAHAHRFIIIYPSIFGNIINKETIQINYKNPHDYLNVLEKYLLPNSEICGGILHLWSFNRSTTTDSNHLNLIDNISLSCETSLYLIQALIKLSMGDNFPTLMVTQIAQMVSDDLTHKINPEQACLLGLIKVVNLEHPNLKCIALDLDLLADEKQQAFRIFEECHFYSKNGENRIAYRSDQRYVEKMILFNRNHVEEIPLNKPFQVQCSKSGLLADIGFVNKILNPPNDDDIVVEVRTVGLNFKDLLTALNIFGSDEPRVNFLVPEPFQPTSHGFEFAGKVIAVGLHVKNFQKGDEIMGFAPFQPISNFVVINENYLIKLPKNTSLEQAATLPIAFITARYALFECGKLEKGLRILIHSAAGGVGLAAVQLAQHIGAQIFATAHLDKWPFLESLGLKNLMNSRTLDYANEILRLTDGQGVDIVLNSFNGKYIEKNLKVLKHKGTFIEIGKRGIWSPQQIKSVRADVQYFTFDLTEKINIDSNFVKNELLTIAENIEKGIIKPLYFKKFPINEICSAFKHMAQAKHIGKIVLNMSTEKKPPSNLNLVGTYLITGGFGGLGELVAEFLIRKGARHLILIGRKISDTDKVALINRLKTLGALTVEVYLVDVSNNVELSLIFNKITKAPLPLKGIIHGAGIIDDAVLTNLNWNKFMEVFSAKVIGTWNLHQLSAQYSLDFFISFSSLTAVLGAYGQANYAAANAFMDACMHQRFMSGHPSMTINWGPWDEKGMTMKLNLSNQQRLARQGFNKLKPEQALKELDLVFDFLGEYSQFAIADIEWSRYSQSFANPYINSYIKPILNDLSAKNKKNNIYPEQLLEMNPTEQFAFLLKYIRIQLGKLTEIENVENLGPETAFADLGVDSLMSVEFSNLIEADFHHKFNMNLFFNFPTISSLIDYLLKNLVNFAVNCH